eukprot:GHVR01077055.1.p1 GENE.GHVR01077055.1~~GHVR01077055.1.p1  ORF type:complete len:158 (-),score=16.51 GHVR01077055.1:73-546(-)
MPLHALKRQVMIIPSGGAYIPPTEGAIKLRVWLILALVGTLFCGVLRITIADYFGCVSDLIFVVIGIITVRDFSLFSLTMFTFFCAFQTIIFLIYLVLHLVTTKGFFIYFFIFYLFFIFSFLINNNKNVFWGFRGSFPFRIPLADSFPLYWSTCILC